MFTAPRDERDAVWSRRFAWGIVVLLAAVAFAIATPLIGDARFRAGMLRRWRQFTQHVSIEQKPSAILNVPFHAQEHALSCEVATLRMVLAYRGVAVSEADLIERVGVDPAPKTATTWGDPDEAFVGTIDGVMGKTGYGVYAGPIGRIAGSYRRAEVIRSGTPAVLVEAIANGNPVITWGYLGRGAPLIWTTLGGKKVTAVYGEHTRVVVGYTGPRAAPEGFHVLDPVYGRQYWTTDAFMKNWEKLGYQGVIVY